MQCYYKLFFDFKEQTAALSDAERGRLVIALIDYARDGVVPKLDGRESILFPVFKSQIDRDLAKSAAMADNGRRGRQARGTEQANGSKCKQDEANESNREQTEANASKCKQTEANRPNKDKEKDKDEDKDEDRGGGVSACAREDAPPPPYGLTDHEITASLDRDRQIEQTARECGLPFAPANMLTARDLAAEHGLDTLIRAMRRAADGKSQTWGYVKGILRSWKQQGYVDDEHKPRRVNNGRPAFANYTQREYSDEELNSHTNDLLLEAAEMGA